MRARRSGLSSFGASTGRSSRRYGPRTRTPACRGSVGGLRPRGLPGRRHPSYAASIFCRFRTLTLRIHGYLQASHNRRERELRRLVLGRRNWLFTWLDEGGERTAAILTILATCIAHDVNPRAYLHIVTGHIVRGWPNSRLRDLLPDRIVAEHPELYVGEASGLPSVPDISRLSA